MYNIRKNEQKEEILLRLYFSVPGFIKGIFIFLINFFLIISVVGIGLGVVEDVIIPMLIFLTLFIIFIVICVRVRNWQCTITNKVIKGQIGVLSKKYFSYRLDVIDDVEVSQVLGMNSLKLTFTKGKTTQALLVNNARNNSAITGVVPFYINWIINVQNAYNKLTKLIGDKKNEADLKVDIEMKKIEAEEKKAEAFLKVAEGITGNSQEKESGADYISQVERLYKLKEQGIITEEEFIEKKKKLL